MKGIALRAYRAEKISLAKAAELAEVSLWEMMDDLRRMGLPVHEYGEEDWNMEKEAIEKMG